MSMYVDKYLNHNKLLSVDYLCIIDQNFYRDAKFIITEKILKIIKYHISSRNTGK